MKIFFYQATTAFPSLKSCEWIGGENSKVFFSHGMEFDKAIITPSLPLNLKGSERVYLIPEGWKAQFLALLNEKYGNRIEASVEHPLSPESKPSKAEIGSGWSGFLAEFYEKEVQVVGVFTVKPKTEIPPPPPKPETCRTQFKSMIQGLSAINDPMRLGIIALLLGLPVSVMFARHLSVEHHGNRIEQVKEALANNNQEYIQKLRKEWQQERIRDRDNPALIVLEETKRAKKDTSGAPQNSTVESPSSANSTPLPPPPKCYIVQSGDNTIKKIAGYFYNPVTDEVMKKIISASIQENNGDKQIYSLQKNGKWSTSKYVDEKINLNWQLVIPNPTTQDPVNLQKLKDCHPSP